ncbi:MAG: DnaJ domain-containing protein [Acidimicrobiales bacterium]
MGKDARHAILGVPAHASEEEIRQAFRRRSLSTHPDQGGRREDFEAVVAAARSLLEERAARAATPACRPRTNPYAAALQGLDRPLRPDPEVLDAVRRVRRAERNRVPGVVPGRPFTSFNDVLEGMRTVA